jgi:hypothetical protein
MTNLASSVTKADFVMKVDIPSSEGYMHNLIVWSSSPLCRVYLLYLVFDIFYDTNQVD